MSSLFDPIHIGNLKLDNRFVRTGTYVAMANDKGEVTEDLIKLYKTLGNGNIGLIISSILYVHPLGKSLNKQLGIYSDKFIPGLTKMVDAIHEGGGKIAIEIVHSGAQTSNELVGGQTIGPSAGINDPVTISRSREITPGEIEEAINAFGEAAHRIDRTGADAIHIDAAGGYLIDQFLSPFFNHREDKWGGSEEKCFRFMKEVYLEVRKNFSKEKPILVKMQTNDYTLKEGIIPSLAAKHAKMLVDLGVDAFEVAAGCTHFSTMNMSRGKVPKEEFLEYAPDNLKRVYEKIIGGWVGKYLYEQPFNLEDAREVKPQMGNIPSILTGGIRTIQEMEQIIKNGDAELIGMCRPFIREPHLVKKLKEGKSEKSECISCNRCLAASAAAIPVRCYVKHFPTKEETMRKEQVKPIV